MYYWRARLASVKKYHAPHVLRGAMLREEALEVLPEDRGRRRKCSASCRPPPAAAETPAEPKRPLPLRDRVMGQKPQENGGLFEVEEEPAE